MFELQFLDQCEFLFDLFADARRNAVRPATAHAFFGQIAQMRDGRHAFRHDFVRIGVFQFAQIEFDLCGDADRFFEQVGRINLGEQFLRAQMALAIRKQRVAGFGDRFAEADGGQHILQRAAGADVHVDVARGDEPQAVRLAQIAQALQFGCVVRLRDAVRRRSMRDRKNAALSTLPHRRRISRRLWRAIPATTECARRSPSCSTSSRVSRYSPFSLQRRPVVMSLQMSE